MDFHSQFMLCQADPINSFMLIIRLDKYCFEGELCVCVECAMCSVYLLDVCAE